MTGRQTATLAAILVLSHTSTWLAGGGHLGRYNRSAIGCEEWQARQASTIDRTGNTPAMFDSEGNLHESAKPARIGSSYQDLR